MIFLNKTKGVICLNYNMNQQRFIIFKHLKIRKENPHCILIFDPQSDNLYELNNIGSKIFLLIKKNTSQKKILKKLKQEYRAPSAKIERELSDFIKRLIKLKIVKIVYENK